MRVDERDDIIKYLIERCRDEVLMGDRIDRRDHCK